MWVGRGSIGWAGAVSGGQGQYRLFHYPSQIFSISKKFFKMLFRLVVLCTPFEPLLVRFPFLPSPDSSHSEERRPHRTLDRFSVRSLAVALCCSPLLCYICRCFPLVWAVCLWAFPQAAIIIILLSPLYLVFLLLMLIYIYDIYPDILCLSCLGDLGSDDYWPYCMQLS